MAPGLRSLTLTHLKIFTGLNIEGRPRIKSGLPFLFNGQLWNLGPCFPCSNINWAILYLFRLSVRKVVQKLYEFEGAFVFEEGAV